MDIYDILRRLVEARQADPEHIAELERELGIQ